VVAIALRTGELGCRHRRVFAGGLTVAAPEQALGLVALRAECRGRELEVEARPLSRYDLLIPA
jgi:hypothetical protein